MISFLAIGLAASLVLLAVAAVVVFLIALARTALFTLAIVVETRRARRDWAEAVARDRWRAMWRRR